MSLGAEVRPLHSFFALERDHAVEALSRKGLELFI